MPTKSKSASRQDSHSPRVACASTYSGQPRAVLVNHEHCQPDFRADQMDVEGPWGWHKFEASHLQDFLQKIFHSQKLTWQNLREHGSHLVDIVSLHTDAQKRLQHLEKDGLDQLYSLRLSGKKRAWGIKEGNILWLLWWDPDHQVCPSNKKHT